MGSRERRSGREKRDRRNRRETTVATFLMGSVKSVDERLTERRSASRRKPRPHPCYHSNVVQRDDGAYCPDCGGWG